MGWAPWSSPGPFSFSSSSSFCGFLFGRPGGWRFLFCPEAVVHHHHSYTGKKDPETTGFLSRRNYLFTVLKSAPLRVFGGVLAALILKDAGNIVHFLKTQEGRRELKRNLRAYASLLKHCRGMMKKRRPEAVSRYAERVKPWMETDYKAL